LTNTEVVEAGPLRASLLLTFTNPAYTLQQKISLLRGSRLITFSTTVQWNAANQMLRAEFPINLRAGQATFEVQYGHIQRTTHYNTLWDMAQFEVVAHKWADLSQPNYGVALINDCKYGHKIKDNCISLNLLRSPKTPDPEADMHQHTFTYALLPHPGNLQQSTVVHEAYQLNIPLRTLALGQQAGNLPAVYSHFLVSHSNIIIEAVKQADNGPGVVVRLYEAHGIDCKATLTAAQPTQEAWLVNLMEEPIEQLPLADGSLQLTFGPFTIHTVKLLPS